MSAGLEAVTIPKWGIEMSEGTVAEWLKGEDEDFSKGDSLVVIETDKIANELEATREARICRILAEPGDVLPVGALIAVTASGPATKEEIEGFIAAYQPVDASFEPADTEENDAVKEEKTEDADLQESAPAVEESYEVPAGLSVSPAALEKARLNRLDLMLVVATGRQGRVLLQDVEQYLKKNNETVPTDKNTGHPVTLANISPMARLLAEELEIDVMALTGSGRRGRITFQDVEQAARRQGVDPTNEAVAESLSVRSSPLARRLAERLGIDLAKIKGTGGRGKILKEDVIASGGSASIPVDIRGNNPCHSEKLSGMRRTIASRLMEAKQTVPHFYLTMDVTMDTLMMVRRQLNERPGAGVRVSVNDLIIRAVALALKDVPGANAAFGGDVINYYERADISVAVALNDGLLTPVIRGADIKSVEQIATEMKDLVTRARNGGLMPEDYQGGSFSISNLGMYGIRNFDAIINPPQGGILAVGETCHRQVYENGAGVWKQQMTVTLSCDHRVIDGAIGAQFLNAFRHRIENAVQLVV
ncbi:2-oxo acid dehydrogenase subunit E2 [Emcibacter sp.]|uniref:2-oxo acid dehydrogenase subunit E2 n=1 Tax=Emcibacter sp. TaxID=1979954 RepID=UPI002AA74A46|nr:2-oxo acid dehydrogenase subunit E2 [Emcibacter sp.]